MNKIDKELKKIKNKCLRKAKSLYPKKVDREFTAEEKINYMQQFKVNRGAVIRELVLNYGLNNKAISAIVGVNDKHISKLRTTYGVNQYQLEEKLFDNFTKLALEAVKEAQNKGLI